MSDKPFPPSAKKLRDARRKGEIPKSAQILSTAVFAVVLMVLMLGMGSTLRRLRELFDAALSVFRHDRDPLIWLQLLERSLGLLMWTTAPVLAAAALAAIAAGWAQTRGLIALDPIVPKFERINPAANLKRLVSLRQFLDLAKKVLETVALGGLIAWVGWTAVGSMLLALYLPPTEAAPTGAKLLYSMFAVAAVFWIAVSALDYGIQYFTFMREQRMSFEDLKRENKDLEGDPYIKAQRRGLHQEMAQQAPKQPRMEGARALIANPTHVGVAITFSEHAPLPQIHAKGEDDDALAMRREAVQLGIPIFEDVPLARALHRELQVGDGITPHFYAPLARIIVCLQELAEPPAGRAGGGDLSSG